MKNMVIKDENAMKVAKSRGRCEWCKRAGDLDPHHILSRGAGRVDIPGNLIGLDRECHTKVHTGEINDFDLLLLAAVREGVGQDAIRETVWLIRRIPKGTTDFERYLDETEGTTRVYARRCLEQWKRGAN